MFHLSLSNQNYLPLLCATWDVIDELCPFKVDDGYQRL